MIVISTLLFTDMYYFNRGTQDLYNNKIAALDDDSNSLPEDAWLKNFNASSYQAILPLPYFHNGSENLCRIATDPEIVRCSYIVSLKTGLPMMGVTSARVSLGQTRKMVPLVLEAIRPIPVLKELPDHRPLLIVVRKEMLDSNEKAILDLAVLIGKSTEYEIYSLDPVCLNILVENRYKAVKLEYSSARKFPTGIFIATDSAVNFVYNSFNSHKGNAYRGGGNYSGKIHEFNAIYDSTITHSGNYTASFWFNHIGDDIYPRLIIEIFATDPAGKAPPYYFMSNALLQLKAIDGNWGLEEMPITIPAENSHLKITVWNPEMKKMIFSKLMNF